MPFIHHDFDLILSYNIIYMKNEITSQNILTSTGCLSQFKNSFVERKVNQLRANFLQEVVERGVIARRQIEMLVVHDATWFINILRLIKKFVYM